ncbi:YigZ family protein, partial [bacterium]
MDVFYKTIIKTGFAEIAERGSRFIAVVERVHNRGNFAAFLEREKVKYPDATHHCWAFRIGAKRTEELSNDDGEPSGSAGLPILRVLSGAELVDVACVVTRYFGGTKLGVGGLM